MAHPELGSRILDGVIAAVGAAAKVENEARLEGRNMSMVLAPDKKAQEAIKKAAEEAAAERAAALAATEMATEPTETPTETEPTETPTETTPIETTPIETTEPGTAAEQPAEMAVVAVTTGDGDERSGEPHAEDEDE
jgi:translation initiation factor IF-3